MQSGLTVRRLIRSSSLLKSDVCRLSACSSADSRQYPSLPEIPADSAPSLAAILPLRGLYLSSQESQSRAVFGLISAGMHGHGLRSGLLCRRLWGELWEYGIDGEAENHQAHNDNPDPYPGILRQGIPEVKQIGGALPSAAGVAVFAALHSAVFARRAPCTFRPELQCEVHSPPISAGMHGSDLAGGFGPPAARC